MKSYKSEYHEPKPGQQRSRPFIPHKERSYSCEFLRDKPRLTIHETIYEKLYRKINMMNIQKESLKFIIDNPEGEEKVDSNISKLFKIKSYADIVESLTAAVYDKTGLHGAQVFLKFVGVLKNDEDRNYNNAYFGLLNDVNAYETSGRKLTHSKSKIMKKALGYTFENENLLLIALTHKSFITNKTTSRFLRSYESLEYLGDAVHKYFLCKFLNNLDEKNLFKAHDSSQFEVVKNDSKSKTLFDSNRVIEIMNRFKSIGESNNLFSLVCVKAEIHECINHTTVNNNVIKEFANQVKQYDAKDQEYLPSINFHEKFKEMYGNPVKMLADVIESCLGAVFLDCIGNEKKGIKEVEQVWNHLVLPYVKMA